MPTIRVLPALVPLLLAVAPLGAQQAACPVDLNQPAVLTQAYLGINRARQADSAAAPKALRDAMRPLQDPKKWAANPVGAGFLKAQLYVLWMLQPGTGETMTNEALGAGGVKTATVDLVLTTDSLLKAVEALGPGCAEETLPGGTRRRGTSASTRRTKPSAPTRRTARRTGSIAPRPCTPRRPSSRTPGRSWPTSGATRPR